MQVHVPQSVQLHHFQVLLVLQFVKQIYETVYPIFVRQKNDCIYIGFVNECF